MMRQLLTASVLAVVVLATPGFAQQDVRITPGSEADREAFLAQRQALLESAGDQVRLLPKGLHEPAQVLVLPFFRVDRSNPTGETTLFAVRNVLNQPVQIRVYYMDEMMRTQRADGPATLPSRGVRTINIRDVSGLAVDADGYSRGLVLITASASSALSGDFFQVNPEEDFATGDRLIDAQRHPYICRLWGMRFLNGGPFSGGTSLNVRLYGAPGTGAGAPPAFQLGFFDEAGQLLSTVFVQSATFLMELAMKDLLPPDAGYPAFGAVELLFSPQVSGGLVAGTYSAEGRFSIGMTGMCLVPTS